MSGEVGGDGEGVAASFQQLRNLLVRFGTVAGPEAQLFFVLSGARRRSSKWHDSIVGGSRGNSVSCPIARWWERAGL
jgi:hypothetical protein